MIFPQLIWNLFVYYTFGDLRYRLRSETDSSFAQCKMAFISAFLSTIGVLKIFIYIFRSINATYDRVLEVSFELKSRQILSFDEFFHFSRIYAESICFSMAAPFYRQHPIFPRNISNALIVDGIPLTKAT